jgi:hypothetical protein
MIKKLLSMAFMLSLSICLSAQTVPGFFAGSGFQFRANSNSSVSGQTFDISLGISPRLGYFITERWALGITGNYRSKLGTVDNQWNTGIFGRYAHPFFEGRLLLWSEAKICYAGSNYYKASLGYYEHGIDASVSAGLMFFPKPKFALEFGIGELLSLHRSLFFIHTQDLAYIDMNRSNRHKNIMPEIACFYFFNRN